MNVARLRIYIIRISFPTILNRSRSPSINEQDIVTNLIHSITTFYILHTQYNWSKIGHIYLKELSSILNEQSHAFESQGIQSE